MKKTTIIFFSVLTLIIYGNIALCAVAPVQGGNSQPTQSPEVVSPDIAAINTNPETTPSTTSATTPATGGYEKHSTGEVNTGLPRRSNNSELDKNIQGFAEANQPVTPTIRATGVNVNQKPTSKLIEQRPVSVVAVSPDITSNPQLTIAGTTAKWGEAITIDSRSAERTNNGRCLFTVKFWAQNIGKNNTGEFISVLGDIELPAKWGQQRWSNLSPGAYDSRSAVVDLKPGQNILVLTLDSTNKVAESNKANNVFRLPVTLRGACTVQSPVPGANPVKGTTR
jgi:hypothetical protein